MSDLYPNQNDIDSPARGMFLITPSDASPIVPLPKGLRFNGAGDVVLRAVDSTADVTITVAAGQVLMVRAQFIRATGTTIVGAIHGLV